MPVSGKASAQGPHPMCASPSHQLGEQQLVNQKANLLSRRGEQFSVQGTGFPQEWASLSHDPTPTPWAADPGNRLTCAVLWVHSPWAPGSPGAITLGKFLAVPGSCCTEQPLRWGQGALESHPDPSPSAAPPTPPWRGSGSLHSLQPQDPHFASANGTEPAWETLAPDVGPQVWFPVSR